MARRALLVAAFALLGACTQAGDQSASPTTAAIDTTDQTTGSGGSDDPGTTGPRSGAVPAAEWSSCGSSFECATVDVPLDHSRPEGVTIELAMMRQPAGDPSKRIGSLFVNPGGPGVSGMETVAWLMLPEEITDRFDLVGFDPRGVGRSTPLDCHTHLQAIYDADPTMEDQADIDHYREVSQNFVDECAEKHSDMLPHMSTVDVAHDLDRLRAAVGDEKLTYLGYSYGTSIGQQYARLYPDRVRAIVLDGVVDPSVDGLTGAEGQAGGFTQALDAYAADCDRDQCLDDPALSVVDQVIAASEARPIPAPGADRPATPGVVAVAMAQALYSDLMWSQLTRALEDARDGDGTAMVRLADSYLRRNSDGSYENGFEVYFGVSCLDSAWPRDFDEVLARGKVVGARYPRLGEALVNDYARCALWPVAPEPLEPVPTDIQGLAPIVVVSTTGDPATPYQSGVDIAERVPGARLVTNVGEGHTVVGNGKDCIDDTVADYFVSLELPEDGLRCE